MYNFREKNKQFSIQIYILTLPLKIKPTTVLFNKMSIFNYFHF